MTGEQALRNIARPVHAFRLRLAISGALGGATQLTSPDKPSIAVMPFQSMSGDPEQEYFGDGIAEDIITALFKLRGFPVIARSSRFAHKGRATNIRQVAGEFGVRHVLEDSVRKAGERLRVTGRQPDLGRALRPPGR